MKVKNMIKPNYQKKSQPTQKNPGLNYNIFAAYGQNIWELLSKSVLDYAKTIP